MAKHILYSDITATAKQPYLKQTHQHYNDMIDELTKAFGETIVYDSSLVTILWGCVNTGTGSTVGYSANISEGYVYYNGEIYYVPAFSVATIANGLKGTITTAYTAADPVLFSDNTTHNVHQIKTIVLSDAAGGLQFSSWVSYKGTWVTKTLTDSDISSASATPTLSGATHKKMYYFADYKNKILYVTIHIEGLEVNATTFSDLKVKLPLSLNESRVIMSTGRYYNSNGSATESAGNTKETATMMFTGAVGYGTYITIYPMRTQYEAYNSDGTNNCCFYGQLTIPMNI